MRRQWTLPVMTLLALALALPLVAACSSLGGSTPRPTAPPTATPTPAPVAAKKGGFVDSPSIPADAATCAAVGEFRKAAAASNGGMGFADIAYPDQSVAYQASASSGLYGYTQMRVCTNATTADATLRFFLTSLPNSAWKNSPTYPYNADAASVCGDPYCWRKAVASDVRYVSLESLSASTSVVAYTLRFAIAPQPRAALTIRSDTRTTYAANGVLVVSASCYGGEQMVGGGYFITSTNHTYTPWANYPSGPSTWTTAVRSSGSASFNLQVYVGCLQANYPLATKIVTANLEVAKGASQTATVQCPSGGVVMSGGYGFSGPVGIASASAPISGMTGWTVVASGTDDALKATVFAVCATRNLAPAPDSTLKFAIANQNDSNQQSIACKSGDQWLLSGGYSNDDPSADGKIVYELDAPTADYSRWFLQGNNLDPVSPHKVTLWADCVTPAPYF